MSVPISPVQLLLAALPMLVGVLLSWRLRLGLGLGRDIVTASVRMTVQLLLVGLVLGWVFAEGRLGEGATLGFTLPKKTDSA